MYVYNDKMNKWLYDFKIESQMTVDKNSHFFPLIQREFYQINDCVFLLRNKTDLKRMKNFSTSDWERILKFHKDKTGYEWCINDLSVNDFYYKELYSKEEQKDMLSVAMNVLEIWGNRLKENFPDKVFCLYLSITEDPFFLNLRFHTYREETEFIWGKGVNEIDKIEQPVLLRLV
ncbi:hypothetical protein [Megasphaera sp. DISK 18]|uniref:hypothetical protein n=1 Tax=Megasphaera sp. DISK 18 TaxID=1776081 RepID=UPI000806F27E|nr:hypothetical protein [Megasphaera sp. DISK 18]OBZ32484.1 hypothetical protein A0U42_10275 [Megasphaera sp. DISK 18]